MQMICIWIEDESTRLHCTYNNVGALWDQLKTLLPALDNWLFLRAAVVDQRVIMTVYVFDVFVVLAVLLACCLFLL